ncbi:MAG: tetratricopeptide repeat protein [Acidobacteriia bacterium]|nr:tetratricopeptide repeat protein [Terriglobia bacterium]
MWGRFSRARFRFRSGFLAFVVVGLAWWAPLPAVAASPTTTTLSERVRQADDYYLGRQKLENVRRALQLLRDALAHNPANYEAWWRLSRAACYLARHTAKPEKIRLLGEAVAAGKRAVALAPQRVEGHFWLGANYGLTAEERNFVKALMLVDSIRQEMETVVRLDPDYEQAGGERTLARLDFRAPFFKGGDKRRSRDLLEKCLRSYPQNSLTMLYLADTYWSLGLRSEAREQLEKILALCPDPLYGPELAENQAEAREKLAKDFHSGK